MRTRHGSGVAETCGTFGGWRWLAGRFDSHKVVNAQTFIVCRAVQCLRNDSPVLRSSKLQSRAVVRVASRRRMVASADENRDTVCSDPAAKSQLTIARDDQFVGVVEKRAKKLAPSR